MQRLPPLNGGEVDVSLNVSLGGVVELVNDVLEPVSGGSSSGLLGLSLLSSELLRDSSLGLDVLLSSLSVLLVSLLSSLSLDSGEGVESVHNLSVSEGVLLLDFMEDNRLSGGSDDALDLIGVDESGEVGGGHDCSLELVALLLLSSLSVRSEDGVEGLEGVLGPDDESSELASGSEESEVESVDIEALDSGDVSGGSEEVGVLVGENDEGTLSESVSLVSELSDSGSDSFGVNDLSDIVVGTSSSENGDEVLSLLNTLELVVQNEGDLSQSLDSVSSGLNQRSDGRGGEGRGNSVSSLGHIDLSVPSSPGLEGSEHSSLSALVTEGSLSGSVGSGSGDSGNSCDGSSGSPGLGRVLHTSVNEDSVSLTGVLDEVGVNEGDDVLSDGGGEDAGEGDVGEDLSGVLRVEDGDLGSG